MTWIGQFDCPKASLGSSHSKTRDVTTEHLCQNLCIQFCGSFTYSMRDLQVVLDLAITPYLLASSQAVVVVVVQGRFDWVKRTDLDSVAASPQAFCRTLNSDLQITRFCLLRGRY